MSDCTPVRFGYGNTLRDASLSSSPRPTDTASINLANTIPKRKTRYESTNEDNQIVITATYTAEQSSSFMSLMPPYTIGNAEVKLELYRADSGADVDRLGMPWSPFVTDDSINDLEPRLPDIFNYWFDSPVSYDSAKLFIRPVGNATLSNVEITNFIIGDYYEMQSGAAFPHSASYMTAPRTRLLSSGKNVNISRRVKSKQFNVPMPFSTTQDRNALVDLELRVGDYPFVVALFPDDVEPWKLNDYSMLAILGNSILHTHVAVGIHTQTLNLLEA